MSQHNLTQHVTPDWTQQLTFDPHMRIQIGARQRAGLDRRAITPATFVKRSSIPQWMVARCDRIEVRKPRSGTAAAEGVQRSDQTRSLV